MKLDDSFITNFVEEPYPKADPEDFEEFPWMMYCLEDEETKRLSALEIFVNLGILQDFRIILLQSLGNWLKLLMRYFLYFLDNFV